MEPGFRFWVHKKLYNLPLHLLLSMQPEHAGDLPEMSANGGKNTHVRRPGWFFTATTPYPLLTKKGSPFTNSSPRRGW